MSHGVADFDIVALFGKRREYARNLRVGEVIPSELEAGFDILGKLDPEWVWVLDCDGTIKGVLVASPAHGAAMIWRVSIAKDASRTALRRLLYAFIGDCNDRGVRGYLTMVAMSGDSQRRLAGIIGKSGGIVVQSDMTLLASPMPKGRL